MAFCVARTRHCLWLLLWSIICLELLVTVSFARRQTIIDHPSSIPSDALHELRRAIEVMQTEYFDIGLGTWPSSIDWTAAVLGTHISAVLSSFSRFNEFANAEWMSENDINRYFSHTITYLFGENQFAIRNQAYDDMLWVVLGWLQAIRFTNSHSEVHFLRNESPDWHGRQFIPAFSHRARVFYELAERGWDQKLCGGGMLWDPRKLPYKNAITNELFIAASAGMYLGFPGDNNDSPFVAAKPIYNPTFLQNAISAYQWLKHSGMTNDHGLYVDGFHIKGYDRNHSKTECDERNEMVYTYNQGVLLSGLRGLWEATGNVSYLEDGHELIRNVIHATGWTEDGDTPSIPCGDLGWCGLGRKGILTELCDTSGTCSQNGQTFKGIFFHHLTDFCASLPREAVTPGKTHGAPRELISLHRASCKKYAPWIMHNGNAAIRTKDAKGRFGMWWGANTLEHPAVHHGASPAAVFPRGAMDYQNNPKHANLLGTNAHSFNRAIPELDIHSTGDLNDRGRGRTVETQSGGVAVIRAMWEFLRCQDTSE